MPAIVWWIIAAIASTVLAYLLRPKMSTPTAANADPPGEAEMPSIEEGKEIPAFFGVVWSEDVTVVWWGDTKIETRSYEESIEGVQSGGKK